MLHCAVHIDNILGGRRGNVPPLQTRYQRNPQVVEEAEMMHQ